MDSHFLSGGGEMGARMRAFDWTRTPLGPPDDWPHGLKTAVRIMLTSRQAMWVGWGPELIYFYNDPYKSIIGGRHPHALGMPVAEVWREIWDGIGPMLATAMRGEEGTYVESQLLIMERNGYPEETYYTFSYSPIPNDRGGTGGIFCANTDDTERVIRERQVAMLQQLTESASAAHTVADASARSLAALEKNPRDIPFALLYLPSEADGTLQLAASAGFAGAPPPSPVLSSEWPLVDALGRNAIVAFPLSAGHALPAGGWDRPPAQAVAVPLADRGQDHASGVLVLGLNPYRLFDDAYRSFVQVVGGQVTAAIVNARADEEERRRIEMLGEIDRAKTAFFSNVSHEFRTPLTLMLGPLEELRVSAEAADVREQATLVHRNALRLLRLVNMLLDFSRIEAGRVKASYAATDLAEYTADLASVFRSATDRAGLELIVSADDIGEPVYVDRQMWETIVLNLLSNAFKYTFHGRIEVRLTRSGREVALVVRDTGIGIAAEDLPHVFERFRRIEGARGRTHEGTGIGLALVSELVQLHGGRIAAASQPGAGTTFTVTLPLGFAHLPADRVDHRAPSDTVARGSSNAFVEEALRWLPSEAEANSALPDLEPSGADEASDRERILLADDNADMRDYVRRLLERRWRIDVVGNGREALERMRAQRPHLIITDVMMPEMDGFALVRAVRGDADLRDLPVVMLSARAGEEATLEGLQAGADDYLVKPFSARELVARVEAQLLRARVRALEERQTRQLTAVFENAPVGVALLRGPDHVFEFANAQYLTLIGNRDILGRPLADALSEMRGQGVVALLDEVRSTGRPYEGRSLRVFVNSAPDGQATECFFDFVYQPMVGVSGAVDGIAVIVYDVTELTRARRDAEMASRAKDEFLAMLGHELRNPLAPILTALQLLKLRGVSAAEREREVIARQVKHLVGLVEDLLDVSRITRGKIQLVRRPVELAEAVAKAIEIASPLFEQKGHELQVDVARHGLAVEADVDRLAQVIANLLTNAAKYTEDGGRVTVSAQARGGDVVLRVRDTGIGIAPDMLPHIFDLFVQERQALDRAQGGLGLGLAIVRSLIDLHGGRVSARSDGQGHGAEFTVQLPRIAMAAAEDAPDEAGFVPAIAAPVVSRRVLIVDDNEDAAVMLRDVLIAYGHSVRTAGDGPSALEVAEQFLPEVAVVDIGLPVMDGYELARRLGSHPLLRATRLVAVTGYGQEQDRRRSATAGFAAHFVKPIDLDQLRALVEDSALG